MTHTNITVNGVEYTPVVDKFKDLKQAYSEGAIIEIKLQDGYEIDSNPTFYWANIYRIKDNISISSWNKHKDLIKQWWENNNKGEYMDYKTCGRCEETKLRENFGIKSSELDGLRSYCKTCSQQESKKQRRTKIGVVSKIYGHQKSSCKKRNHPMPTYTKKWLAKWLFEQTTFHIMYDEWVFNNYDSDFKPSVDRIDNTKSYTESNIRLVSYLQNKEAYYNGCKDGTYAPLSKPVTQLTLEGTLIKTYLSISDASRETGISIATISKCANNIKGYSHSGGYKWLHEQETMQKICEALNNKEINFD